MSTLTPDELEKILSDIHPEGIISRTANKVLLHDGDMREAIVIANAFANQEHQKAIKHRDEKVKLRRKVEELEAANQKLNNVIQSLMADTEIEEIIE